MSEPPPSHLPLVAIVTAGLVIRIAYLVLDRHSPFFGPVLLDAKDYHEWALRSDPNYQWGTGSNG